MDSFSVHVILTSSHPFSFRATSQNPHQIEKLRLFFATGLAQNQFNFWETKRSKSVVNRTDFDYFINMGRKISECSIWNLYTVCIYKTLRLILLNLIIFMFLFWWRFHDACSRFLKFFNLSSFQFLELRVKKPTRVLIITSWIPYEIWSPRGTPLNSMKFQISMSWSSWVNP